MEYENLDASGLYDSYSRSSYVTWRGVGGGGAAITPQGSFTEKFIVSIENI